MFLGDTLMVLLEHRSSFHQHYIVNTFVGPSILICANRYAGTKLVDKSSIHRPIQGHKWLKFEKCKWQKQNYMLVNKISIWQEFVIFYLSYHVSCCEQSSHDFPQPFPGCVLLLQYSLVMVCHGVVSKIMFLSFQSLRTFYQKDNK